MELRPATVSYNPAVQTVPDTSAPPEVMAASTPRGLTRRSIGISLLFAAFFGYAIPVIDFKLNNTYLGSQHFAPGAVGVLLVLVSLNPLLNRLGKQWQLARDEQLAIYLSCLFSCLVAGIGGHNYWASYITGAFYYATPENKWMDALRELPWWMTPALDRAGNYQPQIVEQFFSGNGGQVPWLAWLVPLVAWATVPMAAMLMTGCLSVILRAQWCENEALSFPLLRLPVEMTESSSAWHEGFFKNQLMWCGFGLAAFIQIVNGLNLYFPDVPLIPLGIETGSLFSETPWNQMGFVMMKVFPLAIGLSYLLTSEVSFSLWFFFWFFKFQMIAAYYFGFPPASLPSVMPLGTKTFTGYQEVGAYLAIVALILWSGREHFGHVMRRAFGRAASGARERDEAMPYPLAFWGMVAAFGYLVAWAVLAGVHPGVSFVYWASYVVVSVVLSRVLADSGLLFVSKIHAPLTVWSHVFTSGPGTALGNSAAASAFLAGSGDMRSCLMPSWITTLKLASDRKIPARPLWILCAGAMVVSFVIAVLMHVKLAYTVGALGFNQQFVSRSAPQGVGSQLALFARGEASQGPLVFFWTAFGALMVIGMGFMRSRFLWFPFHPTGYVMGLSWAMHNLWLSVFLGWLAKTLITRFGGHESYRRVLPLFLGLALGDIAMMLFWLVIDGWQGRTGHLLIP